MLDVMSLLMTWAMVEYGEVDMTQVLHHFQQESDYWRCLQTVKAIVLSSPMTWVMVADWDFIGDT